MFDWAIRWSLRNRIAVVALYAVMAVAAVAALGRMVVDVFPEFAPPQVQIQTEVSGYPAKDVEALVTRPLEIALQGAPYIDHIRSNSSVGLSRVTIVFKWGVDIYRARQIVQERLQLVQRQLPGGAVPQLMPVTSAISWLLKFGVVDWSGRFDDFELRSLVDWEFRNRLLAQPGVASVVAVGGEVKQYQVMVDPLRMRKLGISFDDVLSAERNINTVAPGGFLYPTAEEEYFVRANGRVNSLSDLSSTFVAMRDRQPIRLDDVADIKLGGEIKRGDAQMFGGPAIIGTVSKLYGADTLETTRRVESVLQELARSLPEGVQLIPNVFRQASFIDASIANLKSALFHASLIVTLVLLLFLFRWRPTLISLIAIPTSVLMAVLVLWAFNIGINALTLGGLIFAIGEVVDDAIIDVENILRRLRSNRVAQSPLPPLQIVYEGSREIRNSVVYATIIVILAFSPVFFLEGIEGRIFRPLVVSYLAAIGSSLIVAITLVPVLSYYLMGRAVRQRYSVSRFADALVKRYRKGLGTAINYPGVMASIAAILLIVAISAVPFLGRSFLPSLHEGNLVIAATLMPGSSLDESLRMGRQVESIVESIPQVSTFAQRAGRSRLDEDAQPVNFSEFDLTLKPGTRDISGVMRSLRERLAGIPGMAVNVAQFISHRMSEILSGVRAQVVIKIYGSDFSILQEKQQEVLKAIEGVRGIVDLQPEPLVTVPGFDIRVNRQTAAAFGFSPGAVVTQLEQALNGVAVSKVVENDRTFDIFLRVNDDARADPQAIGGLPLTSPSGAVVPVRELVQFVPVDEPYMVNRDNGARRAVVQWNVQGRDLDGVVKEARQRMVERVKLPPGYTLEIGGDYEGQQRALSNLVLSAAVAVALMTVMLFMAFRKWTLVFLILLNLPLALIGGVYALWMAGETLNVASLIGFIALFGVATRNTLLLVFRFQALTAEGQNDVTDITLNGAVDRLTPILMTAFTAALAVIPLVVGDPTGKELERPLAIVLLGGMLSSTLLNLFLIPAIYRWVALRWPEHVSRPPVVLS